MQNLWLMGGGEIDGDGPTDLSIEDWRTRGCGICHECRGEVQSHVVKCIDCYNYAYDVWHGFVKPLKQDIDEFDAPFNTFGTAVPPYVKRTLLV